MTGNTHTKAHLALLVQVIDALAAHHADVVAHEYHYEAFGSWSVVLRAASSHVRVDFDGRDRLLLSTAVGAAGERYVHPRRGLAEQSLPEGLTPETLGAVIAFITRSLSIADQPVSGSLAV